MGRTFRSQALAFLLSALAALAMIAALFGVAAAQTLDAITVSDLMPADGSTVTAGQQVQVSGFISTDTPIALVNNQPDVSVSIDGTPTQVQFVVGSRAVRVGFQTNQAFTSGSHTLQVTAKNVDGETTTAQSTFTAAEGATTTATVVTTATTVPTTATSVAPTATTIPTTATSVAPTVTSVPTMTTTAVAATAVPTMTTTAATATAVPTMATSVATATSAATATTVPAMTPSAVATATAVPAATTSAVATATPSAPTQLPVTGGAPFGVAPVLVLALGTVVLGVGLRRRAR